MPIMPSASGLLRIRSKRLQVSSYFTITSRWLLSDSNR
ncbi:Uncharacterised protein [Vibrio cholerae]|nr:Uncharacterised protein [Vibrio cholerae]